jgi:hypothetical protein
MRTGLLNRMRRIGITANGVAPRVFLIDGVAFVQAM